MDDLGGGEPNPEMDKAQKSKRREAHTQAEKRRRDNINKGYDELQKVVPTVNTEMDPNSGQKISKFQVLLRTIDYVEFLQQQNIAQQSELKRLEREYKGLQIMKSSYEKLNGLQRGHESEVSNQQRNQDHQNQQKLKFFNCLASELFGSFEQKVNCDDVQQLIDTVLQWLEYECSQPKQDELFNKLLSIFHDEF